MACWCFAKNKKVHKRDCVECAARHGLDYRKCGERETNPVEVKYLYEAFLYESQYAEDGGDLGEFEAHLGIYPRKL